MSVFYNMQVPAAEVPPTDYFVKFINDANNQGNQLAQYINGTSAVAQSDSNFEMLRYKNARARALKQNISQKFSGKVYLTDHIFHAVKYKPPGADIEFFNMQKAPEIFHNSVVVLSNNNVMTDNNLTKYMNLYLNSASSVFVIWDFDNHHWVALSSMLAAASDLYIPSHSDNLEPLSRFNNIMAGPIGAGTIQWPRQFLIDNIEIIKNTPRSNEPLGTHIEYPQFIYRQKILQTLHKNLRNVKLVDGSYHDRPMIDRFTEWCSHKAHWIVPVLNDTPIRIFDALITGGIPIVPRALKYHKYIIDLWDHVLFYDYEDIRNPLPITEHANNLFDQRGIQGMLDRHSKVLYNYHVDNRVESILKAAYDEYGILGLV